MITDLGRMVDVSHNARCMCVVCTPQICHAARRESLTENQIQLRVSSTIWCIFVCVCVFST